MRKRCPVIDERLLDGTLDLKILLHLASQLLPEAEREVQTGSTRISMADVRSSPRTDSAFADFGAQNSASVLIQLDDITPYGRGLAHVGCDVAVKQEIADVGKIILGCLKRLPGTGTQANRAASLINCLRLLQPSGNATRTALKSSKHQARFGLGKPFGPQISLEKATGNFRKAR